MRTFSSACDDAAIAIESNRVSNCHFGWRAELTALSRIVSLNGLHRHDMPAKIMQVLSWPVLSRASAAQQRERPIVEYTKSTGMLRRLLAIAEFPQKPQYLPIPYWV